MWPRNSQSLESQSSLYMYSAIGIQNLAYSIHVIILPISPAYFDWSEGTSKEGNGSEEGWR